MSLLSRVRRFAACHQLWRPDTRLIAAVSGGSDSVAMLWLLHDLHRRGELHLAAVAHLNHRIRPEADADEAFCAALAQEIGLPFAPSRLDVPALARANRQSLEVAGRTARRAFLSDLKRTRGADYTATAHTQDDQAETVLLRLLRGAGQRGLAGIAPRRAGWIRPVLWATRAELRRDLERRGQPWRDDVTNTDLANPRNRVRHELLPYLEQQFNPSARRALARLADAIRADDALLARQAATAASAAVEAGAGFVRLEIESLSALPEAIARRVVLHALGAAGRVAPDVGAVTAVLDVARGARAAADVGGLRVEPFGGFVVLVTRAVRRASVPFRYALAVPGEVQMLDAGWIVEAAGPFDLSGSPSPTPGVAHIDAATVGGGLLVRNRRPGDRLRPLGLGGSKKVQDVLVDRKVNRTERDRVPIVTDAHGRIVWVAGHAVGEEFRVTEGTKAVIILKLRRI
ncbi:MAG TPA: tRNA lysidine(34) synthetase TilS [Vicinamibacterales bacterium]|nr:tRNA lysidine(34) synthetase TilS [Vicinamibacterales bacterium]